MGGEGAGHQDRTRGLRPCPTQRQCPTPEPDSDLAPRAEAGRRLGQEAVQKALGWTDGVGRKVGEA